MRSLVIGWSVVVHLLFAMFPAAAAPASWTVDKGVSYLGFTGAMSGQPFSGNFGSWNAEIVFDPNDLSASHVTATVDMASAKTDDQTRDEALPTEDWFAVNAFPRATFASHEIAVAGPDHYVAKGNLTIRNFTRPVSLPFTLIIEGDTAKMSGSLSLDRSAFGVGGGQFKGDDTVALEVQVNIAVTAQRTP
jgi:polyisoprenoid-binding protein YceI